MERHAAVSEFLLSAPVQWLKTLKPGGPPCETIEQLADGLLMNTFMADMDEFFEPNLKDVREDAGLDSKARQHNLGLLVESITVYYQEVLQTIVIMELPIISAICRDPGSEEGISALKKCLMLMLGCSVQCANREMYINHIKSMSSEQQIEMMQLIQEVMEGLIRVPWESMEQMSAPSLLTQCRNAYEHLNRAVAERDMYAQKLDDALQERDFLAAQTEERVASPTGPSQPAEPQSSARHYESVRDLKARLRALSDEMDQQTAAFEELVSENQEKKQQIAQMAMKMRQLQLQADDARQLRDDLEIWKSKAIENERNQVELQRYKEKLEDFEYTTAHLEELKEQNALLHQQNEKLKAASASSELSSQRIASLEKDNRLLQVQIEELLSAQESHFTKFREVNAAKVRLESDKSHAHREIETLKQELEALRQTSQDARPSLSQEAEALSRTEMAHAEQEMRRLRVEATSLKEQLAELETYKRQSELLLSEKAGNLAEIDSLKSQVHDLQDDRTTLRKQYQELDRQMQQQRVASERALSDEKSRMAALESKIGSTLARSVELKEERIRVLEERLEDALKQNAQLKEDVLVYKKHNELLRQNASQQPYVILNSSRNSNADTPRRTPDIEAASSENQELLQQLHREQERASTLERKLQSMQASLDGDSSQLQTQLTLMSEKNEALNQLNSTLTEQLERAQGDLKRLEGSHNKSKEKELHLNERIKILNQFKQTLEQENKTLMAQLNKLLLQNQELLFQAINQNDRLKELAAQDRAMSKSSLANADTVSISSKVSETESEPTSKEMKPAKRTRTFTKLFFKRYHRKGRSDSEENIPARFEAVSDGPPTESPNRNPSAAPQNITSPGSECIGVEQFLLDTKLPPSAFTKSPTVKGSNAMDAARKTGPTQMSERAMTALDFLLAEDPPAASSQGPSLGSRTGEVIKGAKKPRGSSSLSTVENAGTSAPRTLLLDNDAGSSSTDSPTLAGHTPARRSRQSELRAGGSGSSDHLRRDFGMV